MNIFKFLSIIMTAISEFTTEVCEALTTSASAVNNCAKMAETTSDSMLKELEIENEIKLIELKTKMPSEQLAIPLSE
ncbi:MAG: hypothetical protein P8H03_06335 [Emcibacteraceae bacterium]|nr:hypothetical protein [Emcibacteraceae bacterium]